MNMEQIFIRAYADGIVESLRARVQSTPGALDIVAFAAVDLGEEAYDPTVYQVVAKFYWDTYSIPFGSLGASYETVLRLHLLSSRVQVGEADGWGVLNFANIDAAADWIALQASRLA